MLVVSEGWFQFGLIIIMVILLAVSLFTVHGIIKKKKRASKSTETTSSFLVFLFIITLYFSVSLSVPSAYHLDVLIGPNNAHQVEQEHVRHLSFSTVYKVYAIETGASVREAQGTEVTIETTSYEPLYSIAEENESIVRSDQSIDMSAYINKMVVPALTQLDDEEITLTQLRESINHHEFQFQD
ncbi:hypothetical protein [Bacillus sp. JCM 19041]|uniref:hypothetical protein n=1 Tax=Bacillus sp. JCM 19041 TaxID=1460637 RepID=UPI0006D08A19